MTWVSKAILAISYSLGSWAKPVFSFSVSDLNWRNDPNAASLAYIRSKIISTGEHYGERFVCFTKACRLNAQWTFLDNLITCKTLRREKSFGISCGSVPLFSLLFRQKPEGNLPWGSLQINLTFTWLDLKMEKKEDNQNLARPSCVYYFVSQKSTFSQRRGGQFLQCGFVTMAFHLRRRKVQKVMKREPFVHSILNINDSLH